MLTPGSDPVSLRPIRLPSRPQPGLRSGRLSRQGWPPSDADGVSPSPRSRFGRPCRSGRSVGLARPTLLRDSPVGRLSPLLVRPPVASSPALSPASPVECWRTAGRTAGAPGEGPVRHRKQPREAAKSPSGALGAQFPHSICTFCMLSLAFLPAFPASCGCVCKGAYTPWKRAPSAPERGSAASGGCETRRTGVRQRAAERSSRCATPATGPGARGFLYRKPGVGTGTDSRARSTGPEAAGAVTVAGLQGQGAVRTLSRGRSPPGWWGFHTALDARTALC